MADLNVEPKTGRPWWIWLLLALAALAILLFLVRGCDSEDEVTDSTVTETETVTTTETDTDTDYDWNSIDRNAPAAAYSEITDKDVTVRGNNEYAIYSVDETILFGSDSKAIRPQAEQKLQQVSASLGQRFSDGQIRIYAYTDAQGSASYNKELAEERAEAVRNWLVKNGKVNDAKISLHPVGESQPVASNETAKGRQQNRRVEIVARQDNDAD